MKEADVRFNLSLAGELLEFGTDVYTRLFMDESFQGMEHAVLRRVRELTEECFNLKTVPSGEVRHCGEDERMVLIGNHPLYETQWITIQVMTELVANAGGIGKRELLWNPAYVPPLLAWPAWIADLAMFVPRNNHEEAVHVIQNACKKMFRPNTGVVLFTDKHRPTQKAMKEDRKEFLEKYPDYGVENWHYTCFPSSTGLTRVLDGVPNIRVVDFTSCLDRPAPYDATFYVDQEEISQDEIFDPSNRIPEIPGEKPISERERRVRGWLLKRYTWKNTKFIHERQR